MMAAWKKADAEMRRTTASRVRAIRMHGLKREDRLARACPLLFSTQLGVTLIGPSNDNLPFWAPTPKLHPTLAHVNRYSFSQLTADHCPCLSLCGVTLGCSTPLPPAKGRGRGRVNQSHPTVTNISSGSLVLTLTLWSWQHPSAQKAGRSRLRRSMTAKLG